MNWEDDTAREIRDSLVKAEQELESLQEQKTIDDAMIKLRGEEITALQEQNCALDKTVQDLTNIIIKALKT